MISIDPSRRKSGGALLGDRIRMNAIAPWSAGPRVFMRSLATRDFGSEISQALPDVLAACKVAGFDLIVVETSGIGQGDAAIVPLVDVPMYVMTPEFGAASQLEKIDMLDFAEFVAINKFDRKGALDALRDVAKQVQRNKEALEEDAGADAGLRHHGQPLQRRRRDGAVPGAAAAPGRARAWPPKAGRLPVAATRHSTHQVPIVPGARVRYLADIADTVRGYKRHAREQAQLAREMPAAARERAHAARGDPGQAQGARCAGRAGRAARGAARPAREEAAGHVARHAAGLRRRRVRGEDPRQGDPHRAHPHHAVGQQDPQGGAAAATRTTARS